MKNFFKIMIALTILLVFSGKPSFARSGEITTKSGTKMVLIPGGWFTMGSPSSGFNATPHKVWVSPFYMDVYDVTQIDYQRVMQVNPSRWKKNSDPVEQVTWLDAAKYCNKLSISEGLQPAYNEKTWKCNFSANGYRLPTEAEWEFAARAGTNTSYFFGNDAGALQFYAWFDKNADGRTRSVGQKLPNPFGLYDMYGNVWQWCNDFYKADYYRKSPEKNPEGPETGEYKVVRGGSWASPSSHSTSFFRQKAEPGYGDICVAGYYIYGFRCVRNAPK